MFRNLAANLVLNERIETTDAKAKELRRVAERLITKAIRLGEVAYTPDEKLSKPRTRRAACTQAPRRRVHPALRDARRKGGETKKVDLVEKVFVDLAKRFKGARAATRASSSSDTRRGDNAPMSIIEFVSEAASR